MRASLAWEVVSSAVTRTETPDEFSNRCYPLNTDSPHVEHLKEGNECVRFYTVDVTGLAADQIEALMPTVRQELQRRNYIPVFITDTAEFSPFRNAKTIFEAVPDIERNSRLMPDFDWADRRAKCLELIREKWKPTGEMKLSAPLPAHKAS